MNTSNLEMVQDILKGLEIPITCPLNLDELSMTEIAVSLENTFGIIVDEEMEDFKNISTIVSLVEKLRKEQQK